MGENKEKKGLLNNTKQVKGKSLRIWLVLMIIVFMLFTFGIGIYLGVVLFSVKCKEAPPPAPVEEKEKSNVPVMDTFAYIHGSLYFIYDGNVYHYTIVDIYNVEIVTKSTFLRKIAMI